MNSGLKPIDKTKWKIMSTKEEINVVDFLKDFINSHNGCDIIVGTDSQERGRSVTYVTAIVAVFPNNRGSRVVYTKESIGKIKESWMRLEKEAFRSLEVAEYLYKNDVNVTHIELDYQDGDNFSSKGLITKSRPLYSAYSGIFSAIGCHINGKTYYEHKDTNTWKSYYTLSAIAAADKLSK